MQLERDLRCIDPDAVDPGDARRNHFAPRCRFHETPSESPFTQMRLCSLAVPNSRATLSGNEWIVTSLDGTRDVTLVGDEAEAVRLSKRHFGIDLLRHPSKGP